MSERIDKLQSSVKKLAGDVGEIRSEQKAQGKQLNHVTEIVTDMSEAFGEMTSAIKDIQRTQSALANAMTAAMKQLAVDKSLELRMKRVEDAVFGSKH